MSFGNAPARAPVDGLSKPMLDKTRPTGWHPLGMLMPAQHGNATRQFLDQDSYELTIANKYVFPSLLSYSVWGTYTNVLTSRCWPKIKLPEGVQQIGGQEMVYNVMPTTSVPKRGTVRYMSKQFKSWSGAIAQKGIGSQYEGSALNTEYGPQLIAMDIRAYAESIDQGMAINTAINMVNAAHRAPYIRSGNVFGRNVTQEIANELLYWGCIGLNQGRISREVENILNDAPNLNTLLMPDKCGDYIGSGGVQEIDIIIYAVNENKELIRTKSPDKLLARTSFAFGRVPGFEMTTFKLKNSGKVFQPLETVNQIGEVYFMYPEQHPARPGYYHPSVWDLYLYDQPRDGHTKVTGVQAVAESNIWQKKQAGYSHHLEKFTKMLNNPKNERGSINPNVLRQYPISRDLENAQQPYYLPAFFGNLDREHMNSNMFIEAVESIVSLLSYNGEGGKINLAEASDRLKNIDRVREIVEREPYNPAYWAEVARLNIDRSLGLSRDGSGNHVFVGSPTPDARVRSYDMKTPITEWTPNPHGGMDVPADIERFGKPAGMFSAPGLNTIRNMPSHPYSKIFGDAYNTLSLIGDGVRSILRMSSIFSPDEMPSNLPVNDVVQHVITALYGPRVPVFLAAPDNLVQETVAKQGLGSGIGLRGLSIPDVNKKRQEVTPGLIVSVNEPLLQILLARNDSNTVLNSLRDIIIQNTNDLGTMPAQSKVAYGRWLSTRLRKSVLDKKRGDLEMLAKMYVYLDQQTDSEVSAEIIRLVTETKGKNADSAGLDAKIGAIKVSLSDNAIERLAALYNSEASAGVKGASPQLVETYNNLVAVLQEIYKENPAIFAGKKTLKIDAADTSAGELSIGDSTQIRANLKNQFAEALEAFNNARQNLSAAITFESLTQGNSQGSSVATKTTQAGLVGARYFRTPMFFSHALLTTLTRHSMLWILPGDPVLNFSAHVAYGDLIPQAELNLPHYTQSKADVSDRPSSWADVSVFSRVALLSKAFDAPRRAAQSGSFGFNALSAGPIGDYIGYVGGSTADPVDPQGQPQIDPKWAALTQGPMTDRIKAAMEAYAHKPVHRFVALAFLTVPHYSLLSIVEMISKGVCLPFEMWLWRLFSRHLMGSILLLEAGIGSGANFYNGAKFTVGHDAETDVWHTRAVITTDAFAINPQNHRLIRNVQPRLYLGQHDCRFIASADDCADDKATMLRPSIISTLVPRGSHERARVPLSFIDSVPGQVIPGSKETMVVDPDGQHFPGAEYYGHYLFASLFEGHKAIKNWTSSPMAEDLTFAGDNKQNNHLAFVGFHVRYDYNNGFFTHDIPGNGHRAARRLNFPGAKDYLNGSGDYLMEPLPIAQYHLV